MNKATINSRASTIIDILLDRNLFARDKIKDPLVLVTKRLIVELLQYNSRIQCRFVANAYYSTVTYKCRFYFANTYTSCGITGGLLFRINGLTVDPKYYSLVPKYLVRLLKLSKDTPSNKVLKDISVLKTAGDVKRYFTSIEVLKEL